MAIVIAFRKGELPESCAYTFGLFVAELWIETQLYQYLKPAVAGRTCPMTANPGRVLQPIGGHSEQRRLMRRDQ